MKVMSVCVCVCENACWSLCSVRCEVIINCLLFVSFGLCLFLACLFLHHADLARSLQIYFFCVIVESLVLMFLKISILAEMPLQKRNKKENIHTFLKLKIRTYLL